jgi:hypothetical protein
MKIKVDVIEVSDFISARENYLMCWKAGNVYAALQHTHLLGRHLVLEWAEE